MNQPEVEQIAQAVVHEVVRLVFGVDPKDQKAINHLRADLIAAREMREFKEIAHKRFWGVVIGVGTLAAIAAVWETIKVKIWD